MSGRAPDLTYTPAGNYNGPDSFSYTITDGNGGSTAQSATITITGSNDRPIANDDTAAGTENQTLTIDVLANDSDVEDGISSGLTLRDWSVPAGQGTVTAVDDSLPVLELATSGRPGLVLQPQRAEPDLHRRARGPRIGVTRPCRAGSQRRGPQRQPGGGR